MLMRWTVQDLAQASSAAATGDSALIAGLIGAPLAATPAGRLAASPARPRGLAWPATAGVLTARLDIGPEAGAAPAGALLALHVLEGAGTVATAGEEVRFTRGDVLMTPPGRPFAVKTRGCLLALVQVPA